MGTLKGIVAVGLTSLLCSAAVRAGPYAVAFGSPDAVQSAEPAASARTVTLGTLGTGFSVGDPIGTVRHSGDCARSATREWSDLIARRVELELREVFREQSAQSELMNMEQAVPVDAAPFINDLRLDLCGRGHSGWQGDVYVQINWTVSTLASRRVIYQASTSGSVRQQELVRGSPIDGLRQVLTQAVSELLRDGRLAHVLQRPGESSIVAAAR